MKYNSVSKKTKIYAFIALFITFLLFLISPDSYTHDLTVRSDSSIFFMCGKAWMNGLVPYVDYTDSKGPLLWLIYGIGYLISHYDYIGVFWLSCIMYSGVFILIFKTANLFLKDYRLSLICVLLLSLWLFNPWYHYEIRAEDWCQIFLVTAIYRLSLHLYSETKASSNLTAYLLGMCFAGPLLIKYSISVMMGAVMLYALYYYIRSKKNILISLVLFISGACTILLPFILYFLFAGNLEAFVNEYFLNTFKTVQDTNSAGTYAHELLNIFADPAESVLFVISIIGGILFSRTVKQYNYFPLLTIIGFWLITIHHGIDYYYYSISTLFPLWFFISLVQHTKSHFLTEYKKKLKYYCICILSFSTLWNYTFTEGFLLRNLFFYDNDYRTDYYKVAQIMSQVQNPTIIYMHFTVGHGEGTPVGVLPGSKYFFSQYGATPEMEQVQKEDVKKGKADFIVIESNLLTPVEEKLLSEGHYHKCSEYNYWAHCYYVYSKHAIVQPTDVLHMSNLDVLLKANHLM